MKKYVSVNRILSVSEQYLLVSAQCGREMYWEYVGTMQDIKEKLREVGVAIA